MKLFALGKKKEIMCFKYFASHFYNSIDYHTDSNDVSIDCHLKTGMMDQKKTDSEFCFKQFKAR